MENSVVQHENASRWLFLRNTTVALVVGLGIGALIDNLVAWIGRQGDRSRAWAALLAVVQMTLVIALFWLMVVVWKPFVGWIQLTISGLFFSVVFFTVQHELSQNVLRLTRFT